MRSVRSGLWLSVFLLGAAVPAYCQVIVPPNTSGFRVASDTIKGAFEETVYSTGAYDFRLAVYQNAQLKFATGGTVCTTGPLTFLQIPVPFTSLQLKQGDLLTFVFAVRHRTTEGGTTSMVVSSIPVGPPAVAPPPPPPPPPPPTSTKLWRVLEPEFAPWARREENLLA